MLKEELLRSLKNRGISQKVLDAFSKVKREDFVDKDLENSAYNDGVLPIGKGMTISQPYTIGVMLDLLKPEEGQKVLELGSGCGYVSALISVIVGEKGRVYGVEIIPELVEKSKRNLRNYQNVKVYSGNGRKGLKEKAPFDRIIISAACDEIPKKVLHQLKDKAMAVAPIGPQYEQVLISIQRENNTFSIREKVPGFRFVPFR